MALDEQLRTRISDLIGQNRVVLFMKGTRHFPQCGFSATVVQILDELVPEYQTVNVLKEPDIREGIKEYSSWPTIPQLYVDGKFVGGCDIVREMYVSGELQPLFGAAPPSAEPPKVRVTEAAQRALKQARGDEAGTLRLTVSSKFEYELVLDEPQKGDFEVDAGGVTVLVDKMSAKRADGISIDFVQAASGGGGFRIDNPNEPGRVRRISAKDAKAMLDRGEAKLLVDVRTDEELATASIAGARQLDADLDRELESLDKNTPIVFVCHHGMRSMNAAQRYAEKGFRNVYNLEGGIDAWSLEVDSSVPRY